ncbi:TPA: autotransporter outer membrane beta-barrel domain-containing protein [Enterobacter mori]
MKMKIKPLAILVSVAIVSMSTYAAASESTPSQNTGDVLVGQTVSDVVLNGEKQIVRGVVNNTLIIDGEQQITGAVGVNQVWEGEANYTTINGGKQRVMMGVSNHAIVNSGGEQLVSGITIGLGSESETTGHGTANYTVVNDGGLLHLTRSGVVNEATINVGGKMYLYGTSNNSLIDGGLQEIILNGVSNGDTIDNGGIQDVSMNGVAKDTIIYRESTQNLSGGAISEGAEFYYGSTQNINKGSTATDTELQFDSVQNINDGGTADGTRLFRGSVQNVNDGGVAIDTKLENSGATTYGGVTQNVNKGGVAIGTEVRYLAKQEVYGEAKETFLTGANANQNIHKGGVATDTTMIGGGTQNVYYGGVSKNSKLDNSGRQHIYSGGLAMDILINYAGRQYVHENGHVIDTTVNSGWQYIYEGGLAQGTIVKKDQYSSNEGTQTIYAGGKATDTTLADGGFQYVFDGGKTTNTTIEGSIGFYKPGKSVLYSGALADGKTVINNSGQMIMEAGARATDINMNGGTLSVADLSGDMTNLTPAQVDKLTMDGGSVSFLRDSEGDFAALNITELNGTGNFLFNSSLAERSSNFVTIEQGSGQFGIAVTDSGKEISDHTDLTVNLIHEQSGDIEFDMVTASGRSTRAIDGGTYMYTLFSQQDKDGLSGGNVWYLGALTEEPGGENPGGENPGGENPGGENPGGENPGGENPGGENPGGENPGGENPGGENPGGENPGGENPGGENPGGENPGGENPGGENPGGENPGGENPGGGDNGNAGGNGNGGKKPMTTPATDAILAMSNAGLNVVHSELEGLRMYRASLDKTGPESNVWGHYLGSKNNIDTSNGAAYKLNQNGMEIGADTRTDFDRGSLITGAFMSYSDNKVKHARGGKSKIESYGLGLYATWFDASGFYIDGVMKGNRLNNKLSAVMTNGGKTSGDWNQYAFSTAVEGGYQFDLKDDVSITPYARLAFVQMTSEDVKLSNGMKGNTGTPRSVTGEAGAKLAGKFSLGSTEFKPYLTAAVVQEFADSNEVTINERNRFDNNVKGTSGKYGLGASVNVGKDVTFYGEANYRQGSNIETPVQGLAGIRVSF